MTLNIPYFHFFDLSCLNHGPKKRQHEGVKTIEYDNLVCDGVLEADHGEFYTIKEYYVPSLNLTYNTGGPDGFAYFKGHRTELDDDGNYISEKDKGWFGLKEGEPSISNVKEGPRLTEKQAEALVKLVEEKEALEKDSKKTKKLLFGGRH